ncbi:unnamed protein product [Rotaria sp. Silwood1]|nr:unnamed protein product [Rotaria sp. Silwood1]CAF1257696.1 unnamed protein product [Rotaria sp. Silwood1]CAF3458753.1 unnamed protein product [Rotaria sp. Silwood1]CAF3522956.1 unnamed protein product [Rotaria sp. Silwood1]CAF4546359.1 unnamed protein product [Rotaria sp. Silwood1]
MSALTPETTFDDYLNEQLINCLNLQTKVIQNLAQYSRHISFQLIEIRNDVEILADRVITLQQQQQQEQSQFLPPFQIYMPQPSPSNTLSFFHPALQVSPLLNKSFFSNISDLTSNSESFSFSTTNDKQPSRDVLDPFFFGPISYNGATYTHDNIEDTNSPDELPISFKPIVYLPPVEIKTGEEDENILFCQRAKLYRYDSTINEMKERGIGEMKILQHKTTNLCRILMRREQILKVCANHRITSQMELKPHREIHNVYVWSAIDFSDGEGKHETFCIKFKTHEQAAQFVKIFNQAKEINQNKNVDILSIKNISLNDDDIITIGEVKPTLEQIERAKKLQLPLTFYLYENKQPCNGCRGCKEDSSLTQSNENYRMIIKAKRTLPSNRLPPPSLPPPPSLSSYSDHEQTSVGIDQGDEIVTAQTNQKKTRNFSSYNTDPYLLNNYASQMAQTIMDRVKQELYKLIAEQQNIETNDDKTTIVQDDNQPSNVSNINTSSISVQTINKNLITATTNNNDTSDFIFGSSASIKPLNSSFSFSTFGNTKTSSTDVQFSIPLSSSTTNSTSTIQSKSAENMPLFGNMRKLNFADVVKQASDHPLINNDNEARVFPGQGSLIFATKSTDTTTTENDNELTIEFKPIVHLLPVEVKTGEEDENILFCERAKLYRYDSITNEMKERGIGEMKILQHKTTNLCRILMRREQVLKVCANHRITSQMELKEHQCKENAYIWSAMDFSDGQSKHETLCIRFKTNDQAKRFFKQFNDAKQINANIQQ